MRRCITSESQKNNILKTSFLLHSYSRSYFGIVGRGICLFCAHSQFFPPLNRPLSTLLIARQQTCQSVPSLSAKAETRLWASSSRLHTGYLTALPMSRAHILRLGVSHINRCDISSLLFSAWMEERSNVVWIGSQCKFHKHILCMSGWKWINGECNHVVIVPSRVDQNLCTVLYCVIMVITCFAI